jgi:hypothetical protein
MVLGDKSNLKRANQVARHKGAKRILPARLALVPQ